MGIPCSVAGCQKTVHCRGLCGKHYQRERRGTTTRETIPQGFEIGKQSLANLRGIALDEYASTTKRLMAIDTVAALGNFYLTGRTSDFLKQYVAPTERGRRFVIKALRRLLNTQKAMSESTPAAVKTRLLFLRGIALGKGLHRLQPPAGTLNDKKPVPKQSTTLSSIAATLAAYERQAGGTSENHS